MSRTAWSKIKTHPGFYVSIYRLLLSIVFFILALNMLLCTLIFYKYLDLPDRDFYATNGVTAPVKLTPMLSPNYGSTALLSPDPSSDEKEKRIPQ